MRKTFLKEKKEKLKITGSIASAIAIISTSSCSISGNNSDSSKSNSSNITNSYSATTKESTTIQTKESILPETTTTTEKIKPITTQQTTTQETTNVTTIETTTTPFTTVATPKPIETIVTTKTETTKPIITTPKPIVTTTTTATTTKPEPIEYNTRTEEIKAYYNIDLNNKTKLTKDNINDYQTFLTIAYNLYSDTSIEYNKNGYDIFFTNYVVYYNLDTNEYEQYITDSTLERLIFITLLNYEYIDDNTLNKLLKIYTHDELIGLNYNMVSILDDNIYDRKYYDYDKIIVNENLKTLLTNIQSAYKKNDYTTLEKLCNDNFGKYNNMVDTVLLTYEYTVNSIENFPVEETPFQLAQQAIDSMGVYERAHQKTLVLQ